MRNARSVFGGRALASIPAILVMATAAHAQTVTQVSVSAGTSTDERGLSSSSVTLAPAVVLAPDPRVTVSLGASATRFEASSWILGGSGAIRARTDEVKGAALVLSAASGASHSSFGTTFVTAEATPTVEWTAGRISLFGGGRVATARTSVPTTGPGQPVPGPATSSIQSVTRTSLGPVFGARWFVNGIGARVPVTASYREERGRVEDVVAVDRTAGVSVSIGSLVAAGTVGERRAPADVRRFATVAASYALGPAASFDVAVGRYPPDRLTGTAEGRYVAAGLSFRFGARTGRLPAPRGVASPTTGFTRISIRAEDAGRVELFGDWNHWTPARATRAANGVWYVDLPLSPGEYRYAFRIDGKEWRVPDGAVSGGDGFGGKSAYVVVRDTARQPGSDSQEDL